MIIVWLSKAITTRDAQLDFIAKENIAAVIEYGDRLASQADQLNSHPDIGRAGRKQGSRELIISRISFAVIYRVNPKTKRVEILRVLHSSQQWPV
jgi:toxin ParE1/3/4